MEDAQRRAANDRSLQAFIVQDYVACCDRSEALMAVGALPVVAQAFVISMQRLGRQDALEDYGPRLLNATAGPAPWDHLMLRLTLGQASSSQALLLAKNAIERAKVHYYAGERFVTEGREKEARREFDACLALGDDLCTESRLASRSRQNLG